MSSIQDTIRILEQKAIKYENLKGRYIEQAKVVQKASELLVEAGKMLNDLAKEIDPLVKTEGGRVSKEGRTQKYHF